MRSIPRVLSKRLEAVQERDICAVGKNDFLRVLPEMVTFVRVAELGNFSAAADQLGVTLSAVSRQVTKLEKALGIQLIRRTTRQLSLTEAGIEAFNRGVELVAAAQATMQIADVGANVPRGSISISAPKALARGLLHKHILDFLAKYPDVNVHFIVTDRAVDPSRDAVDLVVRVTRELPEGLIARKLVAVEHVLCASPEYLARAAAIENPQDLAEHDCLWLGESDHDNRWRFCRGDAVEEVVVNGRYAVNHSEIRLAGIEAGLGIGCVPHYAVRDALLRGKVLRILADWEFQANYMGHAYILYPPTRLLAPKLRALIDHLASGLAVDTAAEVLPKATGWESAA